ncbi:MAG: 50S ribosomal protein L18 [Bacteroidota bacterium]
MRKQRIKQERKIRRKLRIRKKVHGTAERPRLSVFRSLTHIYAQLINDDEGKTLVSASSIDKEIAPKIKPEMKKSEVAKFVGSELAKRALAAGIAKVTFDRNGFIYHGRVKALADGARDGGLIF